MRLLKILLTGLFAVFALIAGLFIAVVGMLALAIGRLIGAKGAIRVRQPHPMQGRSERARTSNSSDVIDVTATEVPADSWQK
jgi:hypothetical protein